MATGTWNEKEKKRYLVFTTGLRLKQRKQLIQG